MLYIKNYQWRLVGVCIANPHWLLGLTAFAYVDNSVIRWEREILRWCRHETMRGKTFPVSFPALNDSGGGDVNSSLSHILSCFGFCVGRQLVCMQCSHVRLGASLATWASTGRWFIPVGVSRLGGVGRRVASHPLFLSGLCIEAVLGLACSKFLGFDKNLNINSEILAFLMHSSFNRRRELVFMSLLSRENAAPSWQV